MSSSAIRALVSLAHKPRSRPVPVLLGFLVASFGNQAIRGIHLSQHTVENQLFRKPEKQPRVPSVGIQMTFRNNEVMSHGCSEDAVSIEQRNSQHLLNSGLTPQNIKNVDGTPTKEGSPGWL